jgi:hypothetical protein
MSGGKHGGKRQGAGRPVTNPDRPLRQKRVHLYADQTHLPSKVIRKRLDVFAEAFHHRFENDDEIFIYTSGSYTLIGKTAHEFNRAFGGAYNEIEKKVLNKDGLTFLDYCLLKT